MFLNNEMKPFHDKHMINTNIFSISIENYFYNN